MGFGVCLGFDAWVFDFFSTLYPTDNAPTGIWTRVRGFLPPSISFLRQRFSLLKKERLVGWLASLCDTKLHYRRILFLFYYCLFYFKLLPILRRYRITTIFLPQPGCKSLRIFPVHRKYNPCSIPVKSRYQLLQL